MSLLILVGTIACSPTKTVPVTGADDQMAPDPQVAVTPPLSGEIWYRTQEDGDTYQIRRASDTRVMAEGDQFALSDDGALIAVLTDKILMVMPAVGGDQTQITDQVWAFGFRPGTHDLAYLVRDTVSPQMAEWHLRGQDGTDKIVIKDYLLSLLSARISPRGDWLVYPRGPQWVTVSLHDGSSTVILPEPGEFPSIPSWVDADHISITINGSKVVLIKVPTGERETFATAAVPLVAPPVWASDGSTVAFSTGNGVIVFRRGSESVECSGVSSPISWSPNKRYLAMRVVNSNSSAIKTYVWDTRKARDTCTPTLAPGALLMAWHPNSEGMVMKAAPDSAAAGALQVWRLTEEGPVLIQDIGEGSNVEWVLP